MNDVEIRPLVGTDLAAAGELGRIAFGGVPGPPPDPNVPPPYGRHSFGAFDASGRLLAKAVDLAHAYGFGGRFVPGSGVAGVAVAPEARGSGLLRRLLGALVADARDRGAAVSVLYPTTVWPYRKLGWESTGALTWTDLSSAGLAAGRVPEGITLRPAETADLPAVQSIYLATALESTAMSDRSGPLSSPAGLDEFDGITLALGARGIEGYASWQRGRGYDDAATVSVHDLVARTPAAAQGLLAMLGTWRSVAPTVRLRISEDDPIRLLAGLEGARQHKRDGWMLRLIDVAAAVAGRGWPPHLSGSVDLRLVDDLCPWNSGVFRLELAGGSGVVTPGGSGSTVVTPNGLALLYAGAATPAVLRRSGLLTGGDDASDAFLAAAGAGPRPGLLDYF